jgi:hypothetical protein
LAKKLPDQRNQFFAAEFFQWRFGGQALAPLLSPNSIARLKHFCIVLFVGYQVGPPPLNRSGTHPLINYDAVLQATEQILSRFDRFLAKRGELGDQQRGLVVFAEGRFDKRAKVWVREFRQLGTRWGVLRNLCDIPYFASVKETRLLQVADFVAHSVFMLYERRNPSLIHKFIHRFHQRDGTMHGLRHFRPKSSIGPCDCPACYNWNHPGHYGPWL